jgi:VanZ family protein
MNLARIEWGFGIFLLLAAAVVCLIPSREIPMAFDLNDKLSHMIGHAALAAYFSGLVPRRRWWKILLSLIAFGIAIELAQHFMQWGRNGDARDLVANTIGTCGGLLAGFLGVSRWPELLAWMVGGRGTAP